MGYKCSVKGIKNFSPRNRRLGFFCPFAFFLSSIENPNFHIKRAPTSEKYIKGYQKASKDESKGWARMQKEQNPTDGQHDGRLGPGAQKVWVLPPPGGSRFLQDQN